MVLGGWPVGAGTTDRLLINDGFGNFAFAGKAVPATGFGQSNTTVIVRCADLDRDGWDDVVVSQTDDYKRGRVAVWKNNRDRTFSEVTSARVDWASTAMGFVDVADTNLDGWPDILISGYAGGPRLNRVMVNQGNFAFIGVTPAFDEGNLLFADVNGDGRPDLIYPGSQTLLPVLMINR
jgi:hypothetical protein